MSNKRFAFALHGGAGARSGRDYSVAEYHMRELTENARDRLAAGARALDVVEYAVAQMESSGLYVAGRGSAPNSAGYVELDASIMDGPVSAAGAVSCIRDVVSPISVARRVMEATPHVMLSGAGALAFARAQGFDEVGEPNKYYTLPIGVNEDEIADKSHGTVGAVALDGNGELAAATSTGGTFGKLEGRVGVEGLDPFLAGPAGTVLPDPGRGALRAAAHDQAVSILLLSTSISATASRCLAPFKSSAQALKAVQKKSA